MSGWRTLISLCWPIWLGCIKNRQPSKRDPIFRFHLFIFMNIQRSTWFRYWLQIINTRKDANHKSYKWHKWHKWHKFNLYSSKNRNTETYCILDGGCDFLLLLPCLQKRQNTMEQHFQQLLESLEKQGPHLHDQMRTPGVLVFILIIELTPELSITYMLFHGISWVNIVKHNGLVSVQFWM